MFPMQIDTWNRENVNMTGFWPGPQPKNSQMPHGAEYSGLLECPCTDRITKVVDGSINTAVAGSCPASIMDAASCTAAKIDSAVFLPEGYSKAQTGRDPSKPPGCSITLGWNPSQGKPEEAQVYFNEDATSSVGCGGGGNATATLFGAASQSVTGLEVSVWAEVTQDEIRLTIAGPSAVWFGVGINATVMAQGTYAVVVDGHGNISEHSLGHETAGVVLPTSLKLESRQISGNGRIVVVVSRPLTNAAGGRFQLSWPTLQANPALDMIAAVGSGPTFAYHKRKAAFKMALVNAGVPTCICNGDSTNVPFGRGKGFMKVADSTLPPR